MSADIREIYSNKSAELRKAEKELLDYMLWTMKHSRDPHDLYDDPIEVFREEFRAERETACA